MKIISFLLALAFCSITALANDGKLYTIAHVSVVTDSGVVGFPIGTEVVRQKDGKFQIGKYVTTISAFQVTGDKTTVAAIIAAGAQAQAKSAEFQRQAQIQAQERARQIEEERVAQVEAARERMQERTAGTSGALQTSGALGETKR